MNNIYDYLNNSGNDDLDRVSFSIIVKRFIMEDPERANFFCSDQIAKSAFNLLGETAVLIERFFPKLNFESYLTLCIKQECHSRRVCNVLRDNYPSSKHDIFELLTDIICFALATYDKEILWEIRMDYLSYAQVDFELLIRVNVTQSNKAINARSNPLNDLILEIVSKEPKISCDSLYTELCKDEHENVIEHIDEINISFYKYDKQIKVVVTSGLADRLTKAKKKYKKNALAG